jgi:hypothetical protein
MGTVPITGGAAGAAGFDTGGFAGGFMFGNGGTLGAGGALGTAGAGLGIGQGLVGSI